MPLLFERAPCWVAAIDREHRIVAANPAFERRFGPAVGRRCYAVYRQREEVCEDCVAAPVFRDGAERTSDQEGELPSGEVFSYRVQCVPVGEAAGAPQWVLHIATDETETTTLRRDLAQAERLATVGLTTAGLAHSIKNILAGLEGASYLVTSGLEHEDQQRMRGGWEMVHKYVDQVGILVKNLLRYAKATEPQRQRVEPAELVEDIVTLYESKADLLGIAIAGEVASDLPALWIDRESMHACLSNLATNALDACAWDPDSDQQHHVHLRATAGPDGGVVFEVRDDGMGISKENQRKILSSSFTTKGMRGTGLGLLLTKKAVQEHGGTISFESELGQGTSFRISLPAEVIASEDGAEGATASAS